MDQKRKEATEIAHGFVVYLESEQADLNASTHQFDALWQSIYDVCKLVKFGIFTDITQEEYDEAYQWLLDNQGLTEDYQHFILEI